ncbi:hypothetical protein A3C98_03410 [Candidatus Roizmanbacteria bacterium RIFCSPHIGHO2_02_FULL_37_15]|uniref:Transposase IS200-like domain-containing protein n=1 Tax=Candidatus Roizmanbacteria bacterium RIFCSPLOWO2_01_FULL_37_16 TaxID=1802058 RepID=A0A1F7IIT3_9BACT|nr:MAG: hypothetical protein A2859_05315 [Candidatus Roizmanbacteria bacterium RIFCSPHIGHO2_01_FULL_37_16b]OGK20421.1 MAG: hypothetical protein A3C98_03410 [Candidatus Roizmanbacteria bacterium RIFCSPHIGHO2_02_FULL_37_15]OGK34022.1 MAG: hypothetical protein A3F57_02360 [Candidatus Roizmanbacteria bacterium RIFCSPHIGHO2_12_FULL_36_11]OGK43272.1 MAG: hypothetical protein A3B40_02155 [Candidatus Roizmanbacteria bacterium RIFCSPLOWO2_01_FULL_37_16]OGK55866.1 MAG: hypothetical protein A3I50_03200 [C
MSGRNHTLLTNSIYHIYNKTIEQKRVFDDPKICQKFLDILIYYRSSQSILRFSNFQNLTVDLKSYYQIKIFDRRTYRVSILSYCLMPTHFHLLIKQKQENGISFFISQTLNSFTRYHNIINKRLGPIFLHPFKSKYIQTEEQLKHVSRYIHLNPYSSEIVEKVINLEHYPWSSFGTYLYQKNDTVSETEIILSLFNNSRTRYKRFVLRNTEYQKTLEYCKYLNKW